MNVERRARIRVLNDLLRQQHRGGRIMLSSGVVALGHAGVRAALNVVTEFDTFDVANDPYEEHDFGAVEVADHRLFWKIDYFDPSLTVHAADPADPTTCVRVLTIMLAEEL